MKAKCKAANLFKHHVRCFKRQSDPLDNEVLQNGLKEYIKCEKTWNKISLKVPLLRVIRLKKMDVSGRCVAPSIT